MTMYEFFAERLREPSTHATLTALFAVLGVVIDPGTIANVCIFLAGMFGIFGIGLKENAGSR